MRPVAILVLFCALSAGCDTRPATAPVAVSAGAVAPVLSAGTQPAEPVSAAPQAETEAAPVVKETVVPASHQAEAGPAEGATAPQPALEKTAPPQTSGDENPAPTRPKADREPTKPGDPEKITFDDIIIQMPPDVVFRPFMLSERVKELEGKRVRLSGEMWGGVEASEKLTKFILLRNKECKYGPGGAADHLATVVMRKGHTAQYASGTFRVEGVLRLTPFEGTDGNTWHIYTLEDAILK